MQQYDGAFEVVRVQDGADIEVRIRGSSVSPSKGTCYKAMYDALVHCGLLGTFCDAVGLTTLFAVLVQPNGGRVSVSREAFDRMVRLVSWLLMSPKEPLVTTRARILGPHWDSTPGRELAALQDYLSWFDFELHVIARDATPNVCDNGIVMSVSSSPPRYGWFDKAGRHHDVDLCDNPLADLDIAHHISAVFSANKLFHLTGMLIKVFEGHYEGILSKTVATCSRLHTVVKQASERREKLQQEVAEAQDMLASEQERLAKTLVDLADVRCRLRLKVGEKEALASQLEAAGRITEAHTKRLDAIRSRNERDLAAEGELLASRHRDIERLREETEDARKRIEEAQKTRADILKTAADGLRELADALCTTPAP